MHKKIFILVLILINCRTFGQTFEKTFTPGAATSMLQFDDSSYVASIKWLNVDFLKISSVGDSIESLNRTYCTIQKIMASKFGGFIAIGSYIHVGSGSDACIMRLDDALDTIWVKEYPSIGFYSTGQELIELPDSSLILGVTGNAGMSHVGFRLMHLDKDGNVLWFRNPVSWSSANIYNLAVKDSFIYTALNDEIGMLLLNCYNLQTGDTIWEKRYSSYQSGTNTTLHFTNSMILSGSTIYFAGSDFIDSSGIITNIELLFMTDLNGDSIGARNYAEGQFTKIISTPDGNLCCLGVSIIDSVSLTKFDIMGSPIWSNKFRQFDQCDVHDLISTLDNGFAFCGQAIDTTNQIHYTYIVKTDSIGNGVITTIPYVKSPSGLSCFYNSSEGHLHINFSKEDKTGYEVLIYSLDGKLLMKKKLFAQANKIDLNAMATGGYIVVVKNLRGIFESQKIFIR